MCNCGRSTRVINVDELIIEKVLLAIYFILEVFGITKKGISAAERLLRFLTMIVAFGLLVYLIAFMIGVL